jgi:hypothetical protein
MHHDSESVGTLIEKINAMSLEELKGQLPLAQNSLESIELDLEELMALRDVNVIRVAAMTSRLSALQNRLRSGYFRKLGFWHYPFLGDSAAQARPSV